MGESEDDPRHQLRPRAVAGPRAGALIALAFALLAAPLALVHTGWPTEAFAPGAAAPITLRTPHFFGSPGDGDERADGAVVVARGELLSAERARRAREVRAEQPSGAAALAGYALAFGLVGLVFAAALRRSHRSRFLRLQVALFGLAWAGAAAVTVLLVATPASALLIPVAALALVTARLVDANAGFAAGLFAAVIAGALAAFDPGVMLVLAAQACVPVAVLADRRRPCGLALLLAGLAGAAAAAVTYPLLQYLSSGAVPLAELSTPLYSAWVAAAAGGAASGPLAIALTPLAQRLVGDVPRRTLARLEDLDHPLLVQIAEKAPGTWQHSLAMANMAVSAATAIGADVHLVRVGAYFHDLGKSVQPKYFIENLRGGEPSPHDRLPPEVSTDAIFAHVTEGVRLGRKAGLPERVVDFMHMHHGDGLLEYFWAKCQEQGNPKQLSERAFRYPGVPPQSPETAILAICDAVEAASRTLRDPDRRDIEHLVQRIVYGKLHLGQLDESGLGMADLRRIADSLVQTILGASHGRIEYPWQRERARDADEVDTAKERPGADDGRTARLAREPRLDSLDAPRPPRGRPSATEIGSLPTEEVSAVALDPAMADTAALGGAPPLGDGSTRSLRGPELEILDDSDPRVAAAQRDESEAQRAEDSASRLEEWETAIETADVVTSLAPLVGGPPPPPPRRKPSTIPLDQDEDGAPSVAARRADSQDDVLHPGTLIVGPPPSTHPERRAQRDGERHALPDDEPTRRKRRR